MPNFTVFSGAESVSAGGYRDVQADGPVTADAYRPDSPGAADYLGWMPESCKTIGLLDLTNPAPPGVSGSYGEEYPFADMGPFAESIDWDAAKQQLALGNDLVPSVWGAPSVSMPGAPGNDGQDMPDERPTLIEPLHLRSLEELRTLADKHRRERR